MNTRQQQPPYNEQPEEPPPLTSEEQRFFKDNEAQQRIEVANFEAVLRQIEAERALLQQPYQPPLHLTEQEERETLPLLVLPLDPSTQPYSDQEALDHIQQATQRYRQPVDPASHTPQGHTRHLQIAEALRAARLRLMPKRLKPA